MPPVFYYDVTERRVERQEGRADPVEKEIVTRYYTEFDPDPSTVLDRLYDPRGNDSLPPIFYEIEEFGDQFKVPNAAGIKPLSITIQPGNWADRIDWTAQWEVLPERQYPIEILGLKIYDWTKTTTEGQEVSDYLFGHKIFNTSSNSAGSFKPRRTKKPIYTYRGTVPGSLDYNALRSKIAADTSIVGFNYSYRPIQDITTVDITMEEDESLDRSK